MLDMATSIQTGAEWTIVPRSLLRLPLDVVPLPPGFDPTCPETWPQIPGRLEFVQGRLLYMPPCGDEQQETATDVTTELGSWQRTHAEFVVGSNEAGMILGGEVRAADVAIWRRRDLGPPTGRFRRVPPILAVEVAGMDDTVEVLTEKAKWYFDRGVEVVWLLIPSSRSLRVLTSTGVVEVTSGSVPEHPSLPGLTPRVEDLFRQLGQVPPSRPLAASPVGRPPSAAGGTKRAASRQAHPAAKRGRGSRTEL